MQGAGIHEAVGRVAIDEAVSVEDLQALEGRVLPLGRDCRDKRVLRHRDLAGATDVALRERFCNSANDIGLVHLHEP